MDLETRDRLCFVIMPFSETRACTELEWTEIYENVIKPAVEGSGLRYECRRSTAERGNFVKEMLGDLRVAHVVLADLTDRNANVFYELGVRHTLTNRTILITQDRAQVPADLLTYGVFEYSWKTEPDRATLTEGVRRVLREIDENPDRADNPVSDFLLGATPTVSSSPERTTEERLARVEGELEVFKALGLPSSEPSGRAQALSFAGSSTAFDKMPEGMDWPDVFEALND